MELRHYSTGTPEEEFNKGLSDLSKKSQVRYRIYFNEFLDFVKSTPQQLHDFHADPNNKGSLSRAVTDFQVHLVENKGLSPNTATNYRKAINKFLSCNELATVKAKKKIKVPYRGVKIVSGEQIKTLHEFTGKSLRLKAIIMTLKDSGLRVSDLPLLTIEDYNSAIKTYNNLKEEFRTWSKPIITQKNVQNAFVHLGPEAVKAINNYIEDRTTGPIFLTQRKMTTVKGSIVEAGQLLRATNITTLIRNLCKPLRAKGFNVSAHSLRKFFISNLSTKFELALVKLICGKAISDADRPYLDFAESGKLTELYIQNYDAIRVLTKSTGDQSHEIEKLKAQQEMMLATIQNLKDYMDERERKITGENKISL